MSPANQQTYRLATPDLSGQDAVQAILAIAGEYDESAIPGLEVALGCLLHSDERSAYDLIMDAREHTNGARQTDRSLLVALAAELAFEPSFDPDAELDDHDGANPDRERALAEAYAGVWSRITEHLDAAPDAPSPTQQWLARDAAERAITPKGAVLLTTTLDGSPVDPLDVVYGGVTQRQIDKLRDAAEATGFADGKATRDYERAIGRYEAGQEAATVERRADEHDAIAAAHARISGAPNLGVARKRMDEALAAGVKASDLLALTLLHTSALRSF